MATTTPGKLRGAEIAQFAFRAAQLEQYKPIVTYWLRFYMMQKIMAKGLHNADAECNAYTMDLMETLERTKAEHSTEDAFLDDVAAYAYCEQFALDTFARGDNAIRNNKVTAQTVDTFRAATTFFELLTVWKNPLEAEIASKLKYAKYHAVRIAKALKAGEDPNASNPVQEPLPEPMSPLDPADPDVQRITGGAVQTPAGNPYQSYVESAPNTDAQPSPTFSGPRVSPPPQLPAAPTGYSHTASPPTFPSHRDVSPISQPDTSRHGSVASIGGGYFPRVDPPPPTFTSENAAPGLPTAPSIEDEPMTAPFESPPPQIPQAPQAPSPQAFYQNQAPPPPIQPTHQPPPPQQSFQHHQSAFASPPPQQPPFQQSPLPPPPQQQQQPWIPPPFHNQPPPQQYTQPASQALSQGPFKTDEEAVIAAEKHAKWAISALHFEDVNTAVKELRIALKSLGAL